MDLLGGVASAGSNLVGGVMGQRNQAAINTQNINAATTMAQFGLTWRVQDAIRAGINPLAALGSNFSPGPATAVGSNAEGVGIAGAGQDIARALQAYGDRQSKAAQLDLQLKQAQVDQINATTAGQMLMNSKAAVMAQPGAPPGLDLYDASGNQIKTLPRLFKDYSAGPGRITLLDPDAQRSVFSGVPGAVTYPAIAAELLAKNLGNVAAYPGPSGVPLRPDVSRWFNQSDWWGGM